MKFVRDLNPLRIESANRISHVLLAFFCLCNIIFAQSSAIYWQEDWEGDWSINWTVSAGTWEVGIPGSGPGSSYLGQNCAATILNGNYGPSVNTRLEMINPVIIPEADEYPRLRFWHWFNIGGSDGGRVQIKVGEGNWETVSEVYLRTSGGIWSSPSIDLRQYAGMPVRIAFHFLSDGGSTTLAPGWYIDEVSILTGFPVISNPEDWENGQGDWYVSKGIWEIGTPGSGPNAAYEGARCAATILNGNYTPNSDSRLISPQFVVPDAASQPALRFWHWYSIGGSDLARVQIRLQGGEWQTIAGPYMNSSGGIWSPGFVDLSLFGGDTVQVCFYLLADGGSSVGSGWYIDYLEINAVSPNGLGEVNNHLISEQSFILFQNYPNPFNPSTNISYFLPKAATVKIAVYDLLGREIKELTNSYQPADNYNVAWDGTDNSGRLAPSGVYLYRLESGGRTETKKMILLQ